MDAGAGLGLAIAKALVEAQQGRIGVINHGAGLPVRDHPAGGGRPEPTHPARSAAHAPASAA